MVGRHFPNVSLTAEPFEGDLAAFDRHGERQFAGLGVRTLSKGESTLLGLPAITVEADWPLEAGGHHTYQLQVVQSHRGLVLSCAGDASHFEPVRAGCDIIARSLRRANR